MELQPTLESEHIVLRPLRNEDFEALFSVASDRLIWEQHPNSDRYKREVFEKFFQGAMDSLGAFAVIDADTSIIIGSTRFYNLNTVESEVYIGYTFLARTCWGGTYNHEMKRLMIDHAFQHVNRVLFQIGANNLRSQIAVQRIGATYVGTQDLAEPNGSFVKHVVFEIQRPGNR
ncbi:MAG TPA: GNAT family N-acetyltransferase [Candidatus Didemnitutus sp.]|nr:GNAT family N-acetyltransferase [Candidatus Didemnitutus sp.]